jgi:hypothetical protein
VAYFAFLDLEYRGASERGWDDFSQHLDRRELRVLCAEEVTAIVDRLKVWKIRDRWTLKQELPRPWINLFCGKIDRCRRREGCGSYLNGTECPDFSYHKLFTNFVQVEETANQALDSHRKANKV